jgi:hypothetical protein
MRHATSWRKNQSGDDAFGRPLETSTTTTNTVLPFIYLSTRTTKTIHIKFGINLHHQRAIEHIIFIIIIGQKHHNCHQHNVYFLLFIYIFLFIYFSFFVMQQLSNDTSSWSLIESPLQAPLFYNSNTYETLSNGGVSLNDFNNPLLPISIDSLSSLAPHPVTIETDSVHYWAFALVVFPLFTIFGNVLVVVSVYREKSLHTVTNYFVVSLAISDVAVAAVVMPFAIYLEVSI